MTGGVGIAEEWTGDAQDPDHWRDSHVRVRGPVVRSMQGAFAENWLEATGEVLAGDEYLPELEPVGRRRAGCSSCARRAKVGDTNAEALYYLAIASARESIELTAAYFVPRPAFTDALCRRRRARRRRPHPRPRPAYRQGLRPRRRPRRLRRSCSRRGCGCTSSSRRCCTRRRSASTASGRRSAPSTSTTARFSCTTRSPSASGTGSSPARSREAVRRDLERSDEIDRRALERPLAVSARDGGLDDGCSPRALSARPYPAARAADSKPISSAPCRQGDAGREPRLLPGRRVDAAQPGARRARRRRPGGASLPAHARPRRAR